MNKPFKHLSVESDGDRYPKDVYLVDEAGQRIATMETGFPFTERDAFSAGRQIVRACNTESRLLTTLKMCEERFRAEGSKDALEFADTVATVIAFAEGSLVGQ